MQIDTQVLISAKLGGADTWKASFAASEMRFKRCFGAGSIVESTEAQNGKNALVELGLSERVKRIAPCMLTVRLLNSRHMDWN
jgi:hypothetical protein